MIEVNLHYGVKQFKWCMDPIWHYLVKIKQCMATIHAAFQLTQACCNTNQSSAFS